MSSVSQTRHNLSKIEAFDSEIQNALNAWAFEGKGLKGGVLWLVNFSNEVRDTLDSDKKVKVSRLNELATRTIPKGVIQESREVAKALKETTEKLTLQWRGAEEGQSRDLWIRACQASAAYKTIKHNLRQLS